MSRLVPISLLLLAPIGISQEIPVEFQWAQPDRVAIAEAQRREVKRQELEMRRHWNDYVRRMNGVMSKLSDGIVDRNLYLLAMDSWDELEKCEAWPYRDLGRKRK